MTHERFVTTDGLAGRRNTDDEIRLTGEVAEERFESGEQRDKEACAIRAADAPQVAHERLVQHDVLSARSVRLQARTRPIGWQLENRNVRREALDPERLV